MNSSRRVLYVLFNNGKAILETSVIKARNFSVNQTDDRSRIYESINKEFLDTKRLGTEIIPDKCDICILGGGVMGSSTAFWLKQHAAGKALKVVVIERDPKYTKASTVLSLGGVRQQFSLRENIELSLFGYEFLQRVEEYLGIKGQTPPDVQYHPGGYLFLSSTPEGAALLHNNWSLQTKLGSKVELLSKHKLKAKFPFLNVEDLELGSYGLQNEGWFDPWSLLNSFKKKAISLGAKYITADVVDFDFKVNPGEPTVGPNSVIIKTPEGKLQSLAFSHCVLATGYESGRVAKLAGIGRGKGILSYPLPVEPKKRYVYFVHSPNATDQRFPTLIDSSGAHARPEGSPGHFLCGQSPDEDNEPSTENLDVDYGFFDSHVWPNLAHRVPAMENLKIKSAWGGYYDYNTFDQNGVVGTHPAFKNFHFATGFSGHGIQQGAAVGRAIMELILLGKFHSINLRQFSFDRFIEGKQVLEQNIV